MPAPSARRKARKPRSPPPRPVPVQPKIHLALDCRIARAPRAGGSKKTSDSIFKKAMRYASAFSRRAGARVVSRTLTLQEQRAQGRPGARRTRGPVCKNCARSAHGSNHRQGGITPAFPAQWFYGLLRALPGEPDFVVTVALRRQRFTARSDSARHPQTLAPALGRRDHTTSPSAAHRSPCAHRSLTKNSPAIEKRARCCRVHRIPSHVS